jgi:hypothetical protein
MSLTTVRTEKSLENGPEAILTLIPLRRDSRSLKTNLVNRTHLVGCRCPLE